MFSSWYRKQTKILLWTNGLVIAASGMLVPIYALYVKRIGGSLLDASITSSIFFLSAGITSIISGKIVDKIKEDEIMLAIGYLIIGLGYIFYMLVQSPLQLFFVQMLIGFSEALYYPALDVLYSKYVSKEKSGIIWGSYEGMYYFTTAFGAIAGGLIVKFLGFNFLFLSMASLCFISAIYILSLSRETL